MSNRGADISSSDVLLHTYGTYKLGGEIVHKGGFIINDTDIFGLVATFPHETPPISRVIVAKTGEQHVVTHESDVQANQYAEPHHAAALIIEAIAALSLPRVSPRVDGVLVPTGIFAAGI